MQERDIASAVACSQSHINALNDRPAANADDNRSDSTDVAYYYQVVIRPVMEYASPVWHSNLTKGQTKTLEDVQRRAVQIINGNIPYEEACRLLNILPLADRRLELCRTLFQQIMRDDTHVLHHLLPPKCDTQLTGRLRSPRTYPTVYAGTSHFKNSFILHGLNKFQWLRDSTLLPICITVFFVYVWLCVYYVCMYVDLYRATLTA